MLPSSTLRPKVSFGVVSLVVALLVALLGLASAATATTTPTPGPNPNLSPACGAKVILVLDESGSIQTTTGAEAAVRTAAKAFAAGLADTGSQLAVIEFGTSAKRVFNYTQVTGASLGSTFNPYFDGTAASPADVYNAPSQTGQWTNWEDALEEVKLLNTSHGVAPLVVFVTDGDPTATGRTAPFATGVGSATALNPAIVQANAVKAQGSHILAVGVGAALSNPTSLGRLAQVSGVDTVTDPAALNLATTDVLAISNFSNLANALRAIVNELCQSSVTLNKKVDEGQGPVNGGAGWQFAANVTTASGTYTWLTPSPGPAGSRSATTGTDGSVTFQWKPSVSTTSTIGITETERLGYQLAGVTCKVKSLANPNFTNLPVTLSGTSFSANLGPTDVVVCDVLNKKMKPAITIDKSVDKPVVRSGETVKYTLTVTNTGNVPLNGVTVTDNKAAGCSFNVGNLAVGASATHTCDVVIIDDTTNVATVDAKDPQGTPLQPVSNDAVVDVIHPALSITKTVNKATVIAPDTVEWTITVKNTGDVDLTNVAVTDHLAAASGCSVTIGALAAGVTASPITCTSPITEATTNTASVSGTDQLGKAVNAGPAEATVNVIAPGLSITKSTTTPIVLSGATVTWKIQVTNTGDVALTNVTVTDPLAPNCDTTIGTLAANTPAAPISCTSVVTGDLTNVATVTGVDPLENTLTSSASAPVDVINPSFSVTKTVSPQTVLAGTTVTWTVKVANTGDAPLFNINVADPQAPACERVLPTIAVGGSETITCAAVINTDTVNVATVTADYRTTPEVLLEAPGRAEPPPGFSRLAPQSASAAVDVIAPNLSVTKTVNASPVVAGTKVTFTISLTNTGDSAISNIVLSDQLAPGCSVAVGTLNAGASTSVSCEQSVAASMTNVVTATGNDPLGNTITRTAQVPVTVTSITVVGEESTTLSIDKRGPAVAKAGQIITYRITVKNTGAVTATDVVLRDRVPSGMALTSKPAGVLLIKGQVVISLGDLAPGQSKTVRIKFRIDRNTAGSKTNIATVGAANAPTVRDTARTRITRVAGAGRVPIVTG